MLQIKHVSNIEIFDQLKFSLNKENTLYQIGDTGEQHEGTPYILYEDLVFCKCKNCIYTHGIFYKQEASQQIQKGMIMMWSGTIAEIPEGWALCDGQNGRPNLVGRFILGGTSKDFSQKTTTNGTIISNAKTLTVNNLPPHKHNVYINSSGSHSHNYSYKKYTWGVADTKAGSKYDRVKSISESTPSATTGTAGTHSHTVSELTVGSGTSFTITTEIPYYKLAFIIRIK